MWTWFTLSVSSSSPKLLKKYAARSLNSRVSESRLRRKRSPLFGRGASLLFCFASINRSKISLTHDLLNIKFAILHYWPFVLTEILAPLQTARYRCRHCSLGTKSEPDSPVAGYLTNARPLSRLRNGIAYRLFRCANARQEGSAQPMLLESNDFTKVNHYHVFDNFAIAWHDLNCFFVQWLLCAPR